MEPLEKEIQEKERFFKKNLLAMSVVWFVAVVGWFVSSVFGSPISYPLGFLVILTSVAVGSIWTRLFFNAVIVHEKYLRNKYGK